jgi:hypothetical protein
MELQTQATFCNEGFLGMIKILDHDQLFAKIKRSFRSLGIADFVLEKHPQHCLFGFDKELFTVNTDSALVQLLFGPLNYADLGIFGAENLRKIENVLPLKFWIWGWDSI